MYSHRNTSSAVLFVVNREKIDFILRGALSDRVPATRRVYGFAVLGQEFAEVHAPRVARITAVDD